MRDLQAEFDRCFQEVLEAGIKPGMIRSVEVNTRAKKRWGQCKVLRMEGPKPVEFSININAALLDERARSTALHATIVHEILHTVPGCLDHGPKWKQMAARYMDHYPQYRIRRTMSKEEAGIVEDGGIEKSLQKRSVYRYALRCRGCGKVVYRMRMSPFVRHPSAYRCARCGGKWERVGNQLDPWR
jgi:predicted SprT family Zn-dependent metalloprotease